VIAVAEKFCDDDPLILQSLRETLVVDGHAVTATDGGAAGIETFTAAHQRGEPFDVVITDLGMPYVDGRRVATAIKAASVSTPVTLLTGWGQRLLDEDGVPQGVDRVLNKPSSVTRSTWALPRPCGKPEKTRRLTAPARSASSTRAASPGLFGTMTYM
jgi:CheY-like chemotaxis protein